MLNPTVLEATALPKAVYAPNSDMPYIYRGEPEEMISAMAHEMGVGSIEEAIGRLLLTLAVHRKLLIEMPIGLDRKEMAETFMAALLATGVVRPMAEA